PPSGLVQREILSTGGHVGFVAPPRPPDASGPPSGSWSSWSLSGQRPRLTRPWRLTNPVSIPRARPAARERRRRRRPGSPPSAPNEDGPSASRGDRLPGTSGRARDRGGGDS